MRTLKVLFITNHYIDKQIGSSKGSRGFIKVFSELYNDITFIYPDYPGSNIIQYIPENVQGVPCIDTRSKIHKGLDVYRGRLHRYTNFVRAHLKKNRYDIIVIDHSRIWSSLTESLVKSGAKLITIHHNVEKDYVRDNPEAFYLRLPHSYYAMKAERDAVSYSDVNLTHTRKDKDDLMRMYPNAKGNFYHLGAFDYYKVEYAPSKVASDNIFIITGALSYRQSTVPIVEFLKEYWPMVLEERPMAKLIIAGSNPSASIVRACSKQTAVELIANPSDMSSYLDKAKYYICPINLGSGQKTRLSDGLRKGMPILCHDVSLFGYETIMEAGYMFSYHDKITFKDSLKKMLSLSLNGREIFKAYSDFFSLEASVKRLRGFLEIEQMLNQE